MLATFSRLKDDERGATLAEYGLLLMLVALVAIGVLTTFGSSISTMYSNAANEF
jgi:pilus assembly protein Flp/PilA